jgi:hypothetical protein
MKLGERNGGGRDLVVDALLGEGSIADDAEDVVVVELAENESASCSPCKKVWEWRGEGLVQVHCLLVGGREEDLRGCEVRLCWIWEEGGLGSCPLAHELLHVGEGITHHSLGLLHHLQEAHQGLRRVQKWIHSCWTVREKKRGSPQCKAWGGRRSRTARCPPPEGSPASGGLESSGFPVPIESHSTEHTSGTLMPSSTWQSLLVLSRSSTTWGHEPVRDSSSPGWHQ